MNINFTQYHSVVLGGIGSILFLLLLACENPFSTRDPEPPKGNQSNWIQPSSPEYVMVNLKSAIKEKNITNYMRCMADTSNSSKIFHYDAEPSVANNNPSLFVNWDKTAEFNFFNQWLAFIPQDSSSELSLNTLKENTFQDSVILLEEYSLDTYYQCTDDSCFYHMEGQSEFYLLRNSEDLWYIYKWRDISTGSYPTWSHLRAKFGI